MTHPADALPSPRALFDILDGVTYLNNASYTPIPHPVRRAGEAGVAAKAAPWAMEGDAITRQADAVRAAAGQWIGAAAEDIALAPSVAYGVATAAANLPIPAGSRILLMEGEFPSHAFEWSRRASASGAAIDMVAMPADGDWTAAIGARLQEPGLPPVSVAALTPLHWTSGAQIDLAALTPLLHDHDAAIVLDLTQAAGILPIDVVALGADFAMFPTYKWLLGPYTLAFLYAAPHRQAGTGLEQHGGNRAGGAEPFTGQLPPLVPSARRYDMGERFNPVSLPMALAGMELLASWNHDALIARLRWLTDELAAAAERAGWRPVPRAARPPHILGLRPPPGVAASAAVAALARDGVHVADRGGMMRLGVHAYNDESDLAQFARAIAAFR